MKNYTYVDTYFMFFLETNGLKNVLLFLGMWQFPSHVNMIAGSCSILTQRRSLRCVVSFPAGWERAEPRGPWECSTPEWRGGCRVAWHECKDLRDLGMSPQFNLFEINYRLLFLYLGSIWILIPTSFLFSTVSCILRHNRIVRAIQWLDTLVNAIWISV